MYKTILSLESSIDPFVDLKKGVRRLTSPLLLTLMAFCGETPLSAGSYTVTNTNTSGAGSLAQAILDANADVTASTITITTTGTLSLGPNDLPLIKAPNLTINGGTNFTVNGNALYQAFILSTQIPASSTFTLQNIHLLNTKSIGGAGGAGSGGGGAGAGVGGGLLVAPGSNVSLSNVTFQSCGATGGNGGNAIPVGPQSGGGGGGGVGGAGGDAIHNGGAGGGGGGGLGPGISGGVAVNGGAGAGASEANAGNIGLGSFGGDGGNNANGSGGGLGGTNASPNGQNGVNYGGGGGGSFSAPLQASGNGGNSLVGGGGGAGGAIGPSGSGGSGTDSFGGGGGGGGTSNSTTSGGTGGAGGNYGGGGGAGSAGSNTGSLNGGAGGFGGGGGGAGQGGSNVVGGASSFGGFGGTGGGTASSPASIGGGGGGGAGMGGAIFFDGSSNNLTLSITDGGFTSNAVTAGTGGLGNNVAANGGNGTALGKDIFMTSGTQTNINFSATSALTIQEIAGDQGTRGVTGGGLAVSGTGTLTLPGINTYSGDTTVNANSVLAITSDASLGSTTFGSGDVNLNNSGTLQINAAQSTSRQIIVTNTGIINAQGNSYTVNGQVTGTGPLQVSGNGSGIVTLNNISNSYGSGTNIDVGGNVRVSDDRQLGASATPINFISIAAGNLIFSAAFTTNRPVSINGTAVLINQSGGTMGFSGLISGPGSISYGGGNILAITGNNTYSGGTNFTAGQLQLSGTAPLGTGSLSFNGNQIRFIGNTTLPQPTALTNATSYEFTSDAGTTSSISGTISGAGASLLLDGIGNLALTPTTSNTYSGGTTVAGTNVGSSGTNPFGTGLFTFNSGSLTFVGDGTYANNFLLNSNLTLTANPATTSVLNGTLAGSGFTLSGGGTVKLTANNSGYSSNINLYGGTLQVDNNNALGTGVLTFGGGVLELVGIGDTYSNSFSIGAGGGTVILDSLSSNTFTGPISGPGAMTIQSTTLNPGVLTLSGNSGSFIGGFNVNNATVNITNMNNIGSGPLSFDGATLGLLGSSTYSNNISLGSNGVVLNAVGSPNTFSGPIGGSGTLTKSGAGRVILTGANNYSGGTTLNNGILQVQTASNIGNGPLTFNGGSLDITSSSTFSNNVIFLSTGTITTEPGTTSTLTGSLTGVGGFTKNGTGTLQVIQTASNTYSGGTTISAGTLQTQGTNPLGTGAMTFNGGTLELTGNSSFTNSVSLLASEILIADAGTTSTFSGPISGPLGLTKQGTGTVVFTGTNSYSGPTLVTAGSVFENGTLLNSATTVSAGATFGGSGTVSTIDVFGTLLPGFPTGMLTAGNVTFEPGSIFTPLAQGDATSALVSTGNVNIQPGSILLPNLNPTLEHSYTIISTAGFVTGQFLLPNTGVPRFEISVDYFPQSVILELDVVPFADLLPKGNLRNIGVCFDVASMKASPDMAAVLAILNNLSIPEMAAAFQQFDPAFYNALPFAEEAVAERVRKAYTAHTYERNFDEAFQYGVWTSLFANQIFQDGKEQRQNLGYDDSIGGVVIGLDAFVSPKILATGGFSYARSRVKWKDVAAKSTINSYTALVGATWFGSPFTADLYGSYTRHQADGTRGILIEPSSVFAPPTPAASIPISRRIDHKGTANSYTAHAGTIGTLPLGLTSEGAELFGITFVNIDYLYVQQNALFERGGGVLDLVLQEQNSDLLRPEIGVGLGFMATLFNAERIFGDIDVSYVRECRFTGRSLQGSFKGSRCIFTVNGILPTQNLVCPSVRLGISSSYGFDVALSYNASVGTDYKENEGRIELAWVF